LTEPLDVLAVGDLNPDLLVTGDVTPRFGQAEQDIGARLVLGGSAGIFAAGAARLGLRTAIVATVGDDDLGRVVCGMLEARGVDVGLVHADAARPTGLSINLQRDEDRAILTDRGAIPELDVAAAVGAVERGVRHVHLASVFLIPALAREGGGLIAAARSVGATVSVDTNFDPAEQFSAPDWLRDADVLLPNETEALALARGSEGEARGAHANDPVLASARHVAARGALVVVKRGARGALAVRGDDVVAAPAPEATGPDSVGAGDSFDAGLVWALLDGRPLDDALHIACACGALSLRAAGGADGQARLDEALQLGAKLGSPR
jgi:sugar/nucleoside kinase (ribokinase family)